MQQKISVPPVQGKIPEGRKYTSVKKKNSRNPPASTYIVSSSIVKFFLLLRGLSELYADFRFPGAESRHGSKRHGPTGRVVQKQEVFHAYRLSQFSYDVLHAATNKFSKKNFLGRGGFGDVYKGWIHLCTMTAAKPNNGVAIAVKRLINRERQGHEEWQNEVNFLSKISHQNLVKLIGYCSQYEHRILVYEHMAKGSLDAHLSKGKQTVGSVSWFAFDFGH